MFECSASRVQERERAGDLIMLKLEGGLRPERLVTLRVESSVARHLQKFYRPTGRCQCQLRVFVCQDTRELLDGQPGSVVGALMGNMFDSSIHVKYKHTYNYDGKPSTRGRLYLSKAQVGKLAEERQFSAGV